MSRPPPAEPERELLDAGDFGAWLAGMEAALAGGEARVPCEGCTACCRSAQFIDVRRDETDTLAHIPSELLFAAPRRPGHLVLGYDEAGRCPMLTDEGCSIYEHRPRACRAYDCRVFAAAAIEVDEGRGLLAARARRWRFRHPGTEDETRHQGVRSAAAWLQREAASLPVELQPRTATQRAVAAVVVSRCFVARDKASGELAPTKPDRRAVTVELTRRLTSGYGGQAN